MSATAIVLTIFALVIVALAGLIGWGIISTRRVVAMADKLIPPRGKFVEIDGSSIHYYEIGEGKPILFIHGLGGHYHHMRRPLMEAFGPGYRLIALDREGSGHSTRAAGLTGRLPEQARLIHKFIEKLGLERPLLVGHSMGGAVALATALDYPQDISGLVLISPLSQHIAEMRPEFRTLYIPSPALRRFFSSTFAVPLSVRNSEATLNFIFGPQKAPVDYPIEGGAIVGLRPSHFYATSTDIVAIPIDMPAQEKRYGEIEMPVGILFGTGDRVLDYRIHGVKLSEQIPSAELELLEGVGHMPQFVETQRVVGFIERMADRAFAVDRSQAVS